jgi:hypothetical protein
MSAIPGYPSPSPTGIVQAEATLKVITEVLAERTRQIEIGHTAPRDDVYVSGEIAAASAAYALNASGSNTASLFWPWPGHTWRPGMRSGKGCRAPGAREDLIRSAALAIAEIERLDRASGSAVSA